MLCLIKFGDHLFFHCGATPLTSSSTQSWLPGGMLPLTVKVIIPYLQVESEHERALQAGVAGDMEAIGRNYVYDAIYDISTSRTMAYLTYLCRQLSY